MFDFANMTAADVGIQLIGFAAMALGILSYQPKRRVTIILMQTLASVLWTTQFLLLHSIAGAILNGISILRGILYALKDRVPALRRFWLPAVMIAAFVGAGVFTFTVEGPISLLPTVAMVISSVALFLDRENTIRVLSLFVSPPWLIYDAMCGSIAGALNETFVIVSIFIALARYRKQKKEKDD